MIETNTTTSHCVLPRTQIESECNFPQDKIEAQPPQYNRPFNPKKTYIDYKMSKETTGEQRCKAKFLSTRTQYYSKGKNAGLGSHLFFKGKMMCCRRMVYFFKDIIGARTKSKYTNNLRQMACGAPGTIERQKLFGKLIGGFGLTMLLL